jgi:hypothetical protein
MIAFVKFLVLGSNITHVVMLSVVVAQHDETLCVLLRQPILWYDDLQTKSSDVLLNKEVLTAVVTLLLLEDLPYQWINVIV